MKYPSGSPKPWFHVMGDRGMSEEIENEVPGEDPALQAEQEAGNPQTGAETVLGRRRIGVGRAHVCACACMHVS